VDTRYRLGSLIVGGTVAVSLAVVLALVVVGRGRASGPERAGQSLGDQGFPLGSFRLVERSGRGVTDADLADRVWVAAFVFTRCPLSCPRISSVMKGLQGRLEGTGVRLVSLSVDPGHDTPGVLADYARRFGADPDRWWFLTGPKDDVLGLIRGRFKLGVEATAAADQQAGAEAFSHSSRLALVDGGRVVGYYDSMDPKGVESLMAEARRLDAARARPWVRRLPALNAGLNGSCAVLLVVGWLLIRAGRVRGHAVCMTSAVVVSALFLGSYLVYHAQVGSVAYRGEGPARVLYLTILLSHTLLATFGVVPLVALTLTRALRGRFDRHARIARVTLPIWLYVSVTGVVIYMMLYQLPLPAQDVRSFPLGGP
jgi:protein SCO1/2/putative membrane protein